MGQYYIPFLCPISNKSDYSETSVKSELKKNIENDTFKTFSADDYDCPSKLMETSWVGNNYVNAVLSHIHNNPMIVAWIGDYSEEVAFKGDVDESGKEVKCDYRYGAYTTRMTSEEFSQIFTRVMENKISSEPANKNYATLLTHETKNKFLVNHTQRLFVDIEQYINENTFDGDWCINPFPLLTACGNGKGGGDYFKTGTCYEMVGDWAFEVIEYTDKVPEGYSLTMVQFSENV